MQKITPFLWFEKNADEMDAVVDYYRSIFSDVRTSNPGKMDDTPSGNVRTQSLFIHGFQLDLMTAGPYLPFNPTVSFIVNCETTNEADELWEKLMRDGKALMPMDHYDFAEKFGWAQDLYGVSWQILLLKGKRPQEKIIPTLMFCGDVCGRAEEAMLFYTSIFKNSSVTYCDAYDGSEPVNDPRAKTKHAGFLLDGVRFSVLDSGRESPLTFDQGVSCVVSCENQEEIDFFWEKFCSEGGQEVQCGWLKDRFGFPWQIVPARLGEMMSHGTAAQVQAVTAAFMPMKKLDLATLEAAFASAS